MKRLFLSDIHVGDSRSQYQKAIQLIKDENPDELYLVGDILDLWKQSFKKIQDKHFDFLTFLHEFSFEKSVNYIIGNHEDSLDTNSFLFEKIRFHNAIEIEIGCKKAILIHGHQYDDLIMKYYPFARFLTIIHNILIKIGVDFKRLKFSLASEKNTNVFLEVMREVERKAIEDNKEFDILIMGHTHIFKNIKLNDTRYVNLGDWITNLSYAIQEDDKIILKKFKEGEYGDCIHN